jgi:CRISPR-associated endonuclease/helicase Cas3
MHILFVSQCAGNAINETRRIIDQFAERKGDKVWQAPMTHAGVRTVHQMLRKTARRNTAVACHWIKSGGRTELMWIVGKLSAFSNDGAVPTNQTRRNVLHSQRENSWKTAETIALLAGLAALFHDFGKAGLLFQAKLKGKRKGQRSTFEPCRHEWLSLRLFQAFAGGLSDESWLQRLLNEDPKILEQNILKGVDPFSKKQFNYNPFTECEGFNGIQGNIGKVVAWLLLSHHRLPYVKNPKELGSIDGWLTSAVGPHWNTHRDLPCYDKEDSSGWTKNELKQFWTFEKGLPFRSSTWAVKAKQMAKRVMQHRQLFEVDWIHERFVIHLARLSLMFGDHCYSSGEPKERLQDKKYKVFANSDRKTKKLKQRLDEHNIGVCNVATTFARRLPSLRNDLPTISRHKELRKRTPVKKFAWQNRAYELAVGLSEQSSVNGFFGVNMASTGSGKTFANARIMYGLAEEKKGCRFSVALGLRTLTLQTGDALRERLRLSERSLAVLIGSESVRMLHNQENKSTAYDKRDQEFSLSGSESESSLFSEHYYVDYEDGDTSSVLDRFLSIHKEHKQSKLRDLISAPVLVCTVDQLIAATESLRGGGQISPVLRLLTSDLVLDEPDDFGTKDLHALSRFVNWAGLFGSRVLLSSATLPPDLVVALFESYRRGREHYNRNCTDGVTEKRPVTCAWFDELQAPRTGQYIDEATFRRAHKAFVQTRVEKLSEKEARQRGFIIPIKEEKRSPVQAVQILGETIAESINELHHKNHEVHPQTGQRVSFGLVRFSNINPLVAVAQHFAKLTPPPNTRICMCIYHSQFPLAVRSKIESVLDKTLNRKNAETVWACEEVATVLKKHHEKDVVFVVFASPVAEVGRDHDYDWAVIEPSSMRSIIQVAGRVRRHRDTVPESVNIGLLERNYKALTGEHIAFAKPGFQEENDNLSSLSLKTLLKPQEYEVITAAPRIIKSEMSNPEKSLVDLEHLSLQRTLYGGVDHSVHASLWWKHESTWSGELQNRRRFRKSEPKDIYCFCKADQEEPAKIHVLHEGMEPTLVHSERFQFVDANFNGKGVVPWMQTDLDDLLIKIAKRFNQSVADASYRFSQFSLSSSGNARWIYSPVYGFFRISFVSN